MKHVKKLSQARPVQAAAWQDILCELASVLNAVIAAFGGASPIAAYVDDKCALPTPNPTDNNA